MGLLFEPETNEKLKARFKAAMSRVYDVGEIIDHESDRPGQHRENVFDFEDGIRLIISVEMFNGSHFLHVSGSHQKGTLKKQELFEDIVTKLASLNEGKVTGEAQVSETDMGVIHVVLRLSCG